MCTRKGYAASVSQLALATAALYFPFFKPQPGSKRFAAQPQTIYSEFPKRNLSVDVLPKPVQVQNPEGVFIVIQYSGLLHPADLPGQGAAVGPQEIRQILPGAP